MKRRAVLGGLAMLAGGAAACGRGTTKDAATVQDKGGGQQGRDLTDRAKLRMGFVGLNAFVADDNDHYKAGLIDPSAVEDPDNEKFKPHYPAILIDSKSTSAGTLIEGEALKAFRLNTTFAQFQMWNLKNFDVDIAGLPSTKTKPSMTGAVPITTVYPKYEVIADWDKKSWVLSAIPILGGLLSSGPARIHLDRVEQCQWKLTGAKAKDQAEWKLIADLPRLLSDVVEYHADVPLTTTVTLTDRSNSANKIAIPIQTTNLEIWILNMPKAMEHTAYEKANPHELQHVAGLYQLFTAFPTRPVKVPITDPSSYPTSDPIFCPPGSIP